MNNQSNFLKLLEPGMIGNLQIKNRMIMASMGTRLAGIWGEITDSCLEWYITRARGGVGMVTVEASHVAANLFPVRGVVRMPRVDDDCYCPGLYTLAEAVHNADSKISIQLSVGRAASAGSLWTPGLSDIQPAAGKAPSAITFPDGNQPQEMSLQEIQQTVQMYGKAATRLKKVGFDAVELHAHFHSIPGCFMSPLFNKRTDQYGGSFENRLRFILEIVSCIRQNVGIGFPILVKYSINEFISGGRDLKEGVSIARRLQENGVDGIVVSQGQAGSQQVPYAPLYWPPGYMVPLAEALKKEITIPVIAGGRLGDPILAEQVLTSGKADFISLGRPLIADPDLPRKVIQGKTSTIRFCIADNWCFEIFGKAEMRCTLNVAAGQELRYGEIKPADVAKKVLIVGAGPAGMEAARVAGLRGHQVWLYEKGTSLGDGQLRLAAVAKHKEIFNSIASYYTEIYKEMPNVTVSLGQEVTSENILKMKPDTVIIATGGKALVPSMPGVNRKNVITAFEVLSGRINIENKNVVICGGNAVGCETASFLASKGNSVSIVEVLHNVGTDIEPVSLAALLEELKQFQVKILTGRKVESFTDAGVQVVDKTGIRTFLPMDYAVLALGVSPVNELAAALQGKVPEVYVVGDARKPGKIHDAITDGFMIALNI